jgi:hypothetical protein
MHAWMEKTENVGRHVPPATCVIITTRVISRTMLFTHFSTRTHKTINQTSYLHIFIPLYYISAFLSLVAQKTPNSVLNTHWRSS